MPPFEKEGAYCFAHVGHSVGMSLNQVLSTWKPITIFIDIY